MNKKYLPFIVTLLTVLFLIISFSIYKSNRHSVLKIEPIIKKETVKIDTSEILETDENRKYNAELDTIPEDVVPKDIEKIRKNINKNTSKKVAVPQKKIKNIKIESNNTTKTTTDLRTEIPLEKEVIVPVSYKTDNTYKYVYTPTRYNKNK